MTQESVRLCRHLQCCVHHRDVPGQNTLRELEEVKDEKLTKSFKEQAAGRDGSLNAPDRRKNILKAEIYAELRSNVKWAFITILRSLHEAEKI